MLETAGLQFSQLPVNPNSPRALLVRSRQSISPERRVCSKPEALTSSLPYHEHSRELPKTSDLFSVAEAALGALSHGGRSTSLLSPLFFLPPWPASPVITQGRKRRKPPTPQALITGLPDCNYRLLLPSSPNDSHNRAWNSSVRWNQLLSKIGRLIFPRMRYAF